MFPHWKPLRVGLGVLAVSLSCQPGIRAQEIPQEYGQALSILGRKGDFRENVLRVDLPRNDLRVSVDGTPMPTQFGFGGWIAMTKGDKGMEVLMGDLVLQQSEVNPVMSALLDHDLEVTALHNHFFWEEPRIFYMHVHGHGTATDLARRIKPALDLVGPVEQSGHAEAAQAPAPESATTAAGVVLNTGALEKIIGVKGAAAGPVYKFVIGRPDLKVSEMGAAIGTRMGLNSWAAFAGTDEDASVAGDIAMREEEVNAVLKALRTQGLNVVAIHHHMISSRPVVIFLHYWGKGKADALASGFRAALNELGKR